MPLTLGSNIASLGALRALGNSTSALERIFERLASGQRINRASDDAAGLAIADSLRSDSRTYNQALRNINDGISVLSIIDSALEEQTGILGRLSELAEQSANGVYSAEQRAALNDEFQALTAEFGRIGDSTQFNDQSLLSGDLDSLALQVGITSDANSQISAESGDTGSLSGVIDASQLLEPGATQGLILAYFNNLVSMTREEIHETFSPYIMETTGTDASGDERTVLLAAVGSAYGSNGIVLLEFIESDTEPGVFENYIGVDELTNVLGGGTIAFDDQGNVSDEDLSGATFINSGLENVTLGNFDLSGLTRTEGNGSENSFSALAFADISSQTGAQTALEITANRRAEISTLRGEIGAVQSRLGVAANVTSATRENFVAAEARIRDADVATEAAELTRQSILQQTGAAILAQANQQPQITIQLLRDL